MNNKIEKRKYCICKDCASDLQADYKFQLPIKENSGSCAICGAFKKVSCLNDWYWPNYLLAIDLSNNDF